MDKKTDRIRGAIPDTAIGKGTKGRAVKAGMLGAVIAASASILILAASTCGMYGDKLEEVEQEKVIFGEDEAVRIMGEPVSMPEFMLYSVDIKNTYDEAMGEGFYAENGINAQGVNEPYENIVKEEIAESIRMVKVFCAAAEPEYGITLSAEEEEVLKENADSYYGQIVANGVDAGFLPGETVRVYIREEYLAGKVYAYLAKQHPSGEGSAQVDVGNAQKGEAVQAGVLEVSAGLAETCANLIEKYDAGYRYDTHINWELMGAFPFYGQNTYTTEDMDSAISVMLQ